MDPRLFHQADDACVLRQVLLAEELKQQQQQLTAEYLIAMGPCDVVELGLTLTKKETQAPAGVYTDPGNVSNDTNTLQPCFFSFK